MYMSTFISIHTQLYHIILMHNKAEAITTTMTTSTFSSKNPWARMPHLGFSHPKNAGNFSSILVEYRTKPWFSS